jgi:hypothetical protein
MSLLQTGRRLLQLAIDSARLLRPRLLAYMKRVQSRAGGMHLPRRGRVAPVPPAAGQAAPPRASSSAPPGPTLLAYMHEHYGLTPQVRAACDQPEASACTGQG